MRKGAGVNFSEPIPFDYIVYTIIFIVVAVIIGVKLVKASPKARKQKLKKISGKFCGKEG